MPRYGHDYRLEWPVEIFRGEAYVAASSPSVRQLVERGKLLLSEAMSGPQPLRDFQDEGPGRMASTSGSFAATAQFLRDLAENADKLPTERRVYWRQRTQPTGAPHGPLTELDLQHEWAKLIAELDAKGYFDSMSPGVCEDGPSKDDRDADLTGQLSRRAGFPLKWPIVVPADGMPVDDFYTYVEVVHDSVARPRQRSYHQYCDGWHYSDFAIAAGQALYRWRVNEILSRTSLHLRLADDGDDVGLLVQVPDAVRTDLTHRILAGVDNHASDPIARAVMQFRSRGANRQDKQDACRALAHELEGLRDEIKERLLSKDEAMLFETANKFGIRHNRADQRTDYADEYLDWLFWTYLSTIELMRTLAQRTEV